MKKVIAYLTVSAAVLCLSGFNPAGAKGPGGSSPQGRPPETGLEHAETKANPHGLRGIENAEAKQAMHKKSKDRKSGKAKGHYKHKSKPHKNPKGETLSP